MDTQDKLAWEKQCYGMTEEQLREVIQEQTFAGHETMLAASFLSDAQELLATEFNDGWVSPSIANTARQYMNCAKFIMFMNERGE